MDDLELGAHVNCDESGAGKAERGYMGESKQVRYSGDRTEPESAREPV
jgi:hypothetical protein